MQRRQKLLLAGTLLVGVVMVASLALAQQTPTKTPSKTKTAPTKVTKPATTKAPQEEILDAAELEKTFSKPPPRPLPMGQPLPLDGDIVLVKFNGIVNPGMGEYVTAAIEEGETTRAQAVLIELDTPGGLVSTTQAMVQKILGAKVPVIVYVTPSGAHAASAGTFITLAANIAVMAPATRLGAAHPVTGSGEDPEKEGGVHMGRKVENDLIAFIRGIAQLRNRNVEWAVEAVKNSVSIDAEKAVEIGVVDLVATSREDMFAKLDGKEIMIGERKVSLKTASAKVVEFDPTLRQRLLNLLANPGIAMVLGVLGMIGIMIEAYHPGGVVPGVMGVLAILCSLIAMDQLPIDVGGAILVAAGLGLVIAELYTSTYGLLGLLGGLGLTVGLILLIDTNNPGYLVDDSLKLSIFDVLPLMGVFLGFVGYFSFLAMRRKKMMPQTGREALIGTIGFVLKPIGSAGGMVFVSGEYWQAVADEEIAEKEEVEVLSIEGLVLKVGRTKKQFRPPAEHRPSSNPPTGLGGGGGH